MSKKLVAEIVATTVLFSVLACSDESGRDLGEQSGSTGGTATRGSDPITSAIGGAVPSNGGTAIGEAVAGGPGTGGIATGASGTGGMATSGTATGGMATGGAATGGTATGGMATGGAATGGTPTGGTATGGADPAGGAASSGGAPGVGGSDTGGQPGTGGGGSSFQGPLGFASLNGGTTGGQGGGVVTARNYDELRSYAESGDTLTIMIDGTISNGPSGGHIRVRSNKSLIGIGSTAFLDGVGLEIQSSNNVIIRNIKATLVGVDSPLSVNGGDVISINGTSKNIWIDHCEFYSEDPEVQTNIDKYDGLIDIKHQTGFITISYSYIHNHHKGFLVGAGPDDLYDDRKVTFHHNYFYKVVKRMPMMRGSTGHFFNNYVYGTPATEASFVLEDVCLRVEKSVYENVKYSVYTGDAAGQAEMIDNVAPQSRAYPGNCSADIPYDYGAGFIENTDDVPSLVQARAGVGKL